MYRSSLGIVPQSEIFSLDGWAPHTLYRVVQYWKEHMCAVSKESTTALSASGASDCRARVRSNDVVAESEQWKQNMTQQLQNEASR